MAADSQLDRLESILKLTPEQDKQALQIFQNLKDAIDGLTADERLGSKGTQAHRDAIAAIRAILTPEQQQVYDRTPQRLGGASIKADPARQAMNAKLRAFMRGYVRNSAEIAAQVGAFQAVQLNLTGSFDTRTDDDPNSDSGTQIVRVTGSAGAKTFRIDWALDPDGN
ncbi:MAG TPA: hypothetical protein VHV47_10075, partial [Opitutaceae bacterium]|nr:hypothetical protein [Opitutaceae bacterium]